MNITTAELEAALKAALSANWDDAVKAVKDKGLNFQEDLKFADDALAIAALLGVPSAALADALVKLTIFMTKLMEAGGIGYIPPWDPKFNLQSMPGLEQAIDPKRRGQT